MLIGLINSKVEFIKPIINHTDYSQVEVIKTNLWNWRKRSDHIPVNEFTTWF